MNNDYYIPTDAPDVESECARLGAAVHKLTDRNLQLREQLDSVLNSATTEQFDAALSPSTTKIDLSIYLRGLGALTGPELAAVAAYATRLMEERS